MTTIDISWGSLWRIAAVVGVVAAALVSWKIVAGLFLAIVISSGLDFMVDWLERRGVARTLGVIAVFVGLAFVGAALAYVVIPRIIGDLVQVVARFDKEFAVNWIAPLANSTSITATLSKLSGKFIAGGASGIGAALTTIEPLAIAATVIVCAFYLSLSRAGIEDFIRLTLPHPIEEPVLRVYRRSRLKIGNWFRGQVLLGLIVGSITWLCLWAVGVQQAAVFGLLAGICELVPLVGPLVAGAIAVGVTLVSAPFTAIWTFLVFFAMHQIEANVLVPLLTRQTVGLHPVVVITSLLLGYQLGGFMGVLVAVPAAAVLQEVLQEVTRQRHRVMDPELPLPRA